MSDVFVGEFGSIPETEGVSQGHRWPELNGADTVVGNVVLSRLKLLAAKGYSLAAVWPHLTSPGDELEDKMSTERWASIARFAGSGKEKARPNEK